MATKNAEIGPVPGDWIVAPLITYLQRITYGFTNPMPDTDVGPWKITAKDVVDGNINYATARHTSSDAFNNLLTEKSKPQVGDVLLTKDGSIGRVAVVDRNGICINQSVALLRPNDKIRPFFLKYLLLTPHYQRVMDRDSDGSTIKHIYITRVDKMQVAVPSSLHEQEGILGVIKPLDDKIELNRQTNETLEAIARTIFKSWFVDFDPVRAKASGEPPESICRRLRLTPDLLALFPDRLVGSELGEIPEGWEVKVLPSVIQVNPSRSLRRGDAAPYLDMANMPTASARAHGVVQREFGSGTKFTNGDTLVARITPCLENGKTCFVDFLGVGQVGWGSTEYIVLRPMTPLPIEFAYFLARTDAFRGHAIANMTGTSGRQRVPASALDDYRVVVPSEEVCRQFGEYARSTFEKLRASDAEAWTLAQMRDALLPRLLSGELRAPLVGAA
jgi:type I restriction enzyme, S subunit